CAKIRDAEPDRLTYILLMTYGASREEAIRGLRAGADDCIAKPFRLEELLLRISAAHRAIDLSEQNRLQRTLLGRAADILASRGIHVSNAGASEAVVREIARALGAIGQVGKRIECRVDAGEMPEVPWESRALKNFFKSIR
ncbi:MAG: hypothetical protein P4L58_02745, partial [Candidatus Pacebacteria bacterium]|nr:hypothetical protein [Candidatus Paceibacterota bacterium]